ncbi:hypothetical protein pb186bvf_010391 [Paramecium bursaria]
MTTNQSALSHQPKEGFHQAHIHFFDYISEFHGLPDQPDYDVQSRSLMEKLRHQYLHENNWENNLCFRNCFKLNQKKYIEFCLDRKCGGVDFLKAANQLGYVKSAHPPQKADHGHHHH